MTRSSVPLSVTVARHGETDIYGTGPFKWEESKILMDRQPLPIHQNELTWGLVGEAAFARAFFDPGLQQIALDAPLPAYLERR